MVKDSVAILTKFLSDHHWHSRENIVKNTKLCDSEINEALVAMFEVEVGLGIRGKHRPIELYRIPAKQLDMFGNQI
jgi:hypothetical protein